MATLKENKAVVRRYVEEVWDGGNLDLIDELFAPDFVWHNQRTAQLAPAGSLPTDRNGIRQSAAALHSAFPDVRHTIIHLMAEDDLVALYASFQGTHRGSLMGVGPTGKRVESTYMHIFRVRDGRITDRWTERDNLGLLQQLGAVSSPSQGNR